MLFASESPRTSIVTFSACFARCTAAWPAEFPAPTMQTFFPFMPRASLPAAP